MAKKRTTSEASDQPTRRILKRASQACETCRNRKVRCDVVHGVPCHNCKFSGIECHVPESNRKRRWQSKPAEPEQTHGHTEVAAPILLPIDLNPFDTNQPEYQASRDSEVPLSNDFRNGGQNPYSLHQDSHTQRSNGSVIGGLPDTDPSSLLQKASIHGDLQSSPKNLRSTSSGIAQFTELPGYIQPLPRNMDPEDISFLRRKGALSLPDNRLRNALLTSYVEYVYAYAPTIDLLPFLDIVNHKEGEHGKVSLLLLRSILFAGVAFVDFHHLAAAGFKTRRQARKEFYKVCRLLHDFDYEKNRVTLIQSLLLLTYWYETADDPRDTWHWMGVTISLSHTIGLHKNPSESKMALSAQRLWKRIWWSCYMRDREIAIGMRRPIRIKESDYEVPHLTMEDFEFGILPENNMTINRDCNLIRNVEMQREIAAMCMSKARLSTLILLPTKNLEPEKVAIGGQKLTEWLEKLPGCCRYMAPTYESIANGKSCLAVHRALLHMIYYTALQVLMSIENTQLGLSSEQSQAKVRAAAHSNTRITHDLYLLNLDRFLPNAGISVILPALINHLLDIKSSSDQTRDAALRGFRECLNVLERLRDNYAAADFAVRFCQTAIKQGNIALPVDYPKPSTDLFPSLDQITDMSPPAVPVEEVNSQREKVQKKPMTDDMEDVLGNEYFDQQFNEDFGTFAFEEFFDIPIENGEWMTDGQAFGL